MMGKQAGDEVLAGAELVGIMSVTPKSRLRLRKQSPST